MQQSPPEAGSPGVGHVHVPGEEAHRLHNQYVAIRDSVVCFYRNGVSDITYVSVCSMCICVYI